MHEEIFWVWNGWELFLIGIFGLSTFLRMLVVKKFGSGTPLRNFFGIISIIALILTFVLSGWIAGLLVFPLGIILGAILAKTFIKGSFP
ncbi:MAG: hypothetical protein ABII09_12715 [Planctomycetota bacterium]